MKMAVVGSCLSNLTAERLCFDYGFEPRFCVHNNRSDNFLRYHIEQSSQMIPMDYLDSFLVDKEPYAVDARIYLTNQQPDQVGYMGFEGRKVAGVSMFEEMANDPVDVILMDNYMDLGSRLMVHKDPEFAGSPIFLNPHFYENSDEIVEKFEFTDFLTPREAAENWAKIIGFFRKLQPKAKIVFMCFPYSTRRDAPEHIIRGSQFYPELKKALRGDDTYLLPPLDVPDALKVEGDWMHFKAPETYRAIAGTVFLALMAGLPSPSWNYDLPAHLQFADATA